MPSVQASFIFGLFGGGSNKNNASQTKLTNDHIKTFEGIKKSITNRLIKDMKEKDLKKLISSYQPSAIPPQERMLVFEKIKASKNCNELAQKLIQDKEYIYEPDKFKNTLDLIHTILTKEIKSQKPSKLSDKLNKNERAAIIANLNKKKNSTGNPNTKRLTQNSGPGGGPATTKPNSGSQAKKTGNTQSKKPKRRSISEALRSDIKTGITLRSGIQRGKKGKGKGKGTAKTLTQNSGRGSSATTTQPKSSSGSQAKKKGNTKPAKGGNLIKDLKSVLKNRNNSTAKTLTQNSGLGSSRNNNKSIGGSTIITTTTKPNSSSGGQAKTGSTEGDGENNTPNSQQNGGIIRNTETGDQSTDGENETRSIKTGGQLTGKENATDDGGEITNSTKTRKGDTGWGWGKGKSIGVVCVLIAAILGGVILSKKSKKQKA